ncbi:hypothetical protein J2Z21_003858 [Streptomyces griseochromogenes]|uniref:Secreted protein n=1 Tax=Streptomyces griseochromogenes TaxID=68214 RepID=A0A1B1ANP7_9ACTN|nr:DUF6344 domain-containing protein [Streptomyces griseochromogenes]ANP48174.1 hypothetical protein AVL59_00075 [Streptomyces griseochromogenes]MBP2050908.1 hypothetical protein [Streptomyces griseochromogenes]
MTQNKVMKLWTAIVTAFVALFTALGLIATTDAAAAARPETTGKSIEHRTAAAFPATNHRTWSHARALLPPTMKQRIRAEAHGKSPSCRHRPLAETPAETDATHHQSTAPLDC